MKAGCLELYIVNTKFLFKTNLNTSINIRLIDNVPKYSLIHF